MFRNKCLIGLMVLLACFFLFSSVQADWHQDLVGHWELTGDATDETALDNDLTVTGATLTTDESGESNKAYDFDGTNDYFSIADGSQAQLDIAGDFTLAIKLNLDTLGGLAISKYDWYTNDRSFEFELHSDGRCSVHLSDDGTGDSGHFLVFYTDSAVISTDKWIVIGVTFDISAESAQFYVNGIAVDTSLTSGTGIGSTLHDSSAPFAIGVQYRNGVPQAFLDGKVSEVWAWKRVLSAAEIVEFTNSADHDYDGDVDTDDLFQKILDSHSDLEVWVDDIWEDEMQ